MTIEFNLKYFFLYFKIYLSKQKERTFLMFNINNETGKLNSKKHQKHISNIKMEKMFFYISSKKM